MEQDNFSQGMINHGYYVFHGIESRSEYLDLIKLIGRPVPQYDGNLMFDVAKDEVKSLTYYSKGSQNIPPHSDGHDLQTPPSYLLLYCIRESANNDGATEVSDFRKIHASLSTRLRTVLENRLYKFSSKPQNNENNAREMVPINSPIYEATRTIYRYSTNYISSQSSDMDTQDLVDAIFALHERFKTSLMLKSGDVLVINNHHMLHSRTEFTDPTRLLIRAWAAAN